VGQIQYRKHYDLRTLLKVDSKAMSMPATTEKPLTKDELAAKLTSSLRRIVDLPEEMQVMLLDDIREAVDNRLLMVEKIIAAVKN
jgi:hypothetical protein